MTTPLVQTNFVETWLAKAPVWMTRPVIKRFVSAMLLLVDKGVGTLLWGLYARFPGLGTPTALPLIGQSRGMIRGMDDTDQSWAAKLITWLDRWHIAGGQRAIARAVQDYCAGTPKVKVVNRTGRMTTLDSDGTITVEDVTWDWDSLSHPRRNDPDEPFWSEIWIIVYTPPWAIAGPMQTNTPADSGIGQLCPRVDVDAIKQLIDTWKAAHTFVRGVLWSYDAALFDPTTPSTMPDGTWGSWSFTPPDEVPSHAQLSGRGLLCQSNQLRVWEPEREPLENLRRIV